MAAATCNSEQKPCGRVIFGAWACASRWCLVLIAARNPCHNFKHNKTNQGHPSQEAPLTATPSVGARGEDKKKYDVDRRNDMVPLTALALLASSRTGIIFLIF